MALKSIQLAAINPINRAEGRFEVVVHSDDGHQVAMFDCGSEIDAIKLRTAIREHADCLRRVADYRPRPRSKASEADPLDDAIDKAGGRFTI